MAEMAVLKTFRHRFEAEMAQGLLKEQKIESIVSCDDTSEFKGWARLLVQENDFGISKDIIKILEI
jgi:hypothetical protein